MNPLTSLNPLLTSAEWESEAFVNNLVRVEILMDGTSRFTTYNSKHEQTAISIMALGRVGHA